MIWIIVAMMALIAIIILSLKKRKASEKPESDPERDGQYDRDDGSWFADFLLSPFYYVAQTVLCTVVVFTVGMTSVVIPGGQQIALLDRIYMCTSIQNGRNVALPGECGRQAEILMPGFKFSLAVRVLNNVTFVDMINVPDGRYATLTARDGLKLEEGQVAARPWPLGKETFVNEDGKEVTGNMLDATFFLTDGGGRKGPQVTILTPGRYPVNTYLWDVEVGDGNVRTSIQPGHVAVIKSAIDDDIVPSFVPGAGTKTECGVHKAVEKDLGQIKAVLVPLGCRGVWKEPIPSGEYYLNRKVYEVTEVDTRVQNWTYKGGYTRRYIDLRVEDDGGIKQEPRQEEVKEAEGAAGEAIAVKAEGWTVFQELRIQARVQPEFASLVVAAVGGMKEIEDRIITPQVRSVLRNVGGSRITVKNTAAYEEAESELNSLKARLEILKDVNTDIGLSPEQRAQETGQIEVQIASFSLPDPTREVTRPTKVLDFQNERAALEQIVAKDIRDIGTEAGIEIVSVTFGNTDLPPELLVARKVEQLSGQLRKAYSQMRSAQVLRQATEAAKARADKQHELVSARIAVETSIQKIKSRENDGEAEKRFLEKQAEGQKAQVKVLGEERVTMLRALQLILEKPEIVTGLKLPNTVVFGGKGPEGLGAVLAGTKLFGGPATPANEVAPN